VVETFSRQPRTKLKKDQTSFFFTGWERERPDEVPKWGQARRNLYLREFAKTEPILSGAVFSMVSKMVSSDWKIVGGRNRVSHFHDILSGAEDGKGWGYFIDRAVQDYICTDMGAIVELGREPGGPVAGIYNIDSCRAQLTGNVEYPLVYSPVNGGEIRLAAQEFSRVVDLPSSDESRNGLGFCAVSRALKVAKVLLALYNYEEERLKDLPPQGIASITGLTQDEVQSAFDLYDAKRISKEQTTFAGLLWFCALDNPLQQVAVKLESFASLPEHFDRDQVTTLYVFTLALDFGVDAREFWPASQAGATKAEAEVQASKAKTKGPGRLYSSLERMINYDIMPPGIDFTFVKKDAEESMSTEVLREVQIRNIRALWNPASFTEELSDDEIAQRDEAQQEAQNAQSQGEGQEGQARVQAVAPAQPMQKTVQKGMITTDEARRLLVEIGALPEWVSRSGDEAAQYSLETKGLGPGEELVEMNRKGDFTVLRKSVAYSFPISLLPLSKVLR